MSDLDIRKAALDLAAKSGGTPEEIIARADAFYEFMRKAARPGRPKEKA